MGRMLKIEFKRVFKNNEIKITLMIGILIVLSQYIKDVLPCVKFLDDYVEPDMQGLYPHCVFNKWIGGGESVEQWLYFMLLPILTAFVYADSLYLDMKSGYIKNMLVKVRRKTYYLSKAVVVFLVSGFTAVIPLILNFLLTAATLPCLLPQVSAGTFPLFSTSMWSGVFYSHPLLYVGSYMLLIFVFTGLLSGIALLISFFVQNRFLVVLAPFIIYLFSHTIFELFESYGMSKFSALSFLNPSQPSADGSEWVILMESLILFSVWIVYLLKSKKEDIY